jgi:hypothetical protein
MIRTPAQSMHDVRRRAEAVQDLITRCSTDGEFVDKRHLAMMAVRIAIRQMSVKAISPLDQAPREQYGKQKEIQNRPL